MGNARFLHEICHGENVEYAENLLQEFIMKELFNPSKYLSYGPDLMGIILAGGEL